jgi:SAM-dependent methyltransferase
MNFNRIYEYRFRGIDRNKKLSTWKVIAAFIYKRLESPITILDPAAGNCEFINLIQAKEKWAVDMNEATLQVADKDVKVVIGNNLDVSLPLEYFDAIYVSNFLEHLYTQEQVATFLERMFQLLKIGGRICIMGPNFKYCYREYFDFADHTVILSELGVAEHLYGAGFKINELHPRFLPLSFRGKIPINDFLVRMYLSLPFFWRFFGKQFLIIAQK